VVRAEGSSPPDLSDRDASKAVPTGEGWVCAHSPSSMGTPRVQEQILPDLEERDLGILSCPASLCSFGGFWEWSFFSPTLMND